MSSYASLRVTRGGGYSSFFIYSMNSLRTLTATPEALLSYLQGLSNSQFRHASKELGERILVDIAPECFWAVFKTLFLADRKAYLGTLLKALTTRVQQSTESLWSEVFIALCHELTDTDRRKVLQALLPLLPSPQQAERLLLQCGLTESSTWIPHLLQVKTPPCAFLLLKALRYIEHDRALLIRTCYFLIKTGDPFFFNFASLMRTSFALEEVRGTFSLSLQPYEISRLEQNYDAFLAAMRF